MNTARELTDALLMAAIEMANKIHAEAVAAEEARVGAIAAAEVTLLKHP